MEIAYRIDPARLRYSYVGIFLAATLALAACNRGSPSAEAHDPPKPGSAVELSGDQLSSVRIETARIESFPVEVEAPGSVSFVDDPAVVQAESTLLGTAATYNLTRKELVRVRSLGTSNGVAEKEMEQAISDEQTAEAAYKAARDAVRALGKTEPEIDRMVATGKIESRSAVYREIKWIIASVAESDSPLVRVGQPVVVVIPALGGTNFQGTVSEIYSTVDPGSHRVTIRAQVADSEDELRPGMLADVSIAVRNPELSVGIAENGIVREGDGTMTAWVTSDRRRFAQRVVTIGTRENGRVQVLKGLRQGEQVVTDGAVFLDNMINAAPSD